MKTGLGIGTLLGLAAIGLSACAAPAAREGPTREQAAFADDLVGRRAGEPQRCLPSTLASPGVRIIDRQTLVYRQGPTLWVNRLRDACPGLRPGDTLIVEQFGGQLCSGDPVRSLSPGSTIPGPTCLLGPFTPWRRPS